MRNPGDEVLQIRGRLHDAIRKTSMISGSLQTGVNTAFSKLRAAVHSMVSDSQGDGGAALLAAADELEAACRLRMELYHADHVAFLEETLGMTEKPSGRAQVLRIKADGFDELSVSPLEIMRSPVQETDILRPAISYAQEHRSPSPHHHHYQQAPPPKPWMLPSSSSSQQSRPSSRASRPSSRAETEAGRPSSRSSARSMSHRPGTAPTPGAPPFVHVLHAIPNLSEALPMKVDQWPAKKHTSSEAARDAFVGPPEHRLPARGYAGASKRGLAPPPEDEGREGSQEAVRKVRSAMLGGALSGGGAVNKPKELTKIERYIEVEWRRRRCKYEEWTPDRYGMFRDAFHSITKAFTTWAPMLTAVKREYDGWVSHLAAENYRLRVLEAKLTSADEDLDEKIYHIRKEAEETVHRGMIESGREALELRGKLAEVQSEMVAKDVHLERVENELEQLKSKLPDTERQLKLVIKGYNEQLKDMRKMMAATGASSVGEMETRFKGMVQVQAMWDLEARMAEEKASVEAHAKELQTRLNEERNSSEEARTAKQAAEEEKEQVTTKLSAALKHLPVLFPDVKTLRIGASGQLCVVAKGGGGDAPQHVKADLGSAISAIREAYLRACADRDGFRARLRDVSAVLQEKVRVEEEAAKQWKATEWIVARGDSDEVPEVLRWSGQVKNRNLTKKETCKVTKQIFARRLVETDVDIWAQLQLYAAANYGAKARYVEWAYSYIDALRKYEADVELRSMHAVLEGTMLEETYRAACQLLDDVIEKMQEAEGAIRKPLVGKLPRADFLSIVARLLGPRKGGGITMERSKAHFEELARELAKDEAQGNWGVNQKEVQYITLFNEGRDGSPGAYCSAFRNQYYQQRVEYVQDIVKHLLRCRGMAEGEDEDPNSSISPKELKQTLRQMDPDKPPSEVDALATRVFGRKNKLSWGDFSGRMVVLHCERTTPRTDRRVAFALKPVSDLLRLARRKTKHVLLYIRVCKAFRSAMYDYRDRKREHPP